MATVLACLVFALIAIIGLPLIWVVGNFSPRQYKKLVDLENQRRMIAHQIVCEHAESDWLTRMLFRRYLKKGGGFL